MICNTRKDTLKPFRSRYSVYLISKLHRTLNGNPHICIPLTKRTIFKGYPIILCLVVQLAPFHVIASLCHRKSYQWDLILKSLEEVCCNKCVPAQVLHYLFTPQSISVGRYEHLCNIDSSKADF